MTVGLLEALTRSASDGQARTHLVRARFEALAEWGVPTADALEIGNATDVDILEAVVLLRHGCPSDLVLGILA